MRTAALAGSLLLLTATALNSAAEVYWTPQHLYAPQGISTRVTAGDLDGDGDYDLSMLGVNPARQFWNVGSSQLPQWELDTTQYSDVPYCGYRAGALGDVDDDGDLDLVVTCDDECLRFYRNTGTAQGAAWTYEATMFESVDIVSGGAEPYLVDLDTDGDLDILVACSFGYVLQHMENVGVPSAPEWVDRSTVLVIGPGSQPTIALGDLDGDGDEDLVSITWDSPPRCWENTGTLGTFNFLENPSMLTGVEGPQWGKGIELFDVDADGDPDLLITHYLGENFLYLNERITPVRPTSWGRIKALYR
jgi:hypothetical protein